ncbi:hypothetical protein MRX96_009951 [Rhipicephalus microplus]
MRRFNRVRPSNWIEGTSPRKMCRVPGTTRRKVCCPERVRQRQNGRRPDNEVVAYICGSPRKLVMLHGDASGKTHDAPQKSPQLLASELRRGCLPRPRCKKT